MKLYNALDLRNGVKADFNKNATTFNMPLQMLIKEEKDDQWKANNMDWLEWQGVKQIRYKVPRLLKNYKLANGIIDESDYIISEDNPNSEMIDILTRDQNSPLKLKFYPLIPQVLEVLSGEFSKRSNKIQIKAVDEFSNNEYLQARKDAIDKVLIQQAQQELARNLIAQGVDLNSDQAQQQLSEENIKSLPEVDAAFKKSYKSVIEQWAGHQCSIDDERFKIYELENIAFRDMLITDMEFWHIKMDEDDYELELWNPILVFYHKSPEIRYIAEGNFVGKIELLHVADIVDKYGYLMTDEQLKSLEQIYPIRNSNYLLSGWQNDGSYYDPRYSHASNVNAPSLQYRKLTSFFDAFGKPGNTTLFDWIINNDQDYILNRNMLRVTTAYWKSQKRVGHLTKIDEDGIYSTAIVSEDYQITDKPIYDTEFFTEETKDNLIFGEHIDWIWINEVWGGVKIGPNLATFGVENNPNGISPIYINVKPVRFQLKGESSLYGCKLPVEGSRFTERNSVSTPFVERMMPFQVQFNLVNNQISDILVDELGMVVVLDQNTLPRHSMGEDWGKNNLAKAYVAMKDFQILPLDTSLTNTETVTNFQHLQSLDLSQTKRLLGKIQLAMYFKEQCFESIGITKERMGTVAASQTATGTTQAVNNSYAQTEMYFTRHSNFLMPRVREMLINTAQYYMSNKHSVRLSYINDKDENVFFELEGARILPRDFNVFAATKPNSQEVINQLKQFALSNNTNGASIYDLASIVSSETPAELLAASGKVEAKARQMQEAERQHEKELQDLINKGQETQLRLKQTFEAEENEKNRQAQILEAEIKASGYGAMKDTNANGQNDYLDALDRIQQSQEYRESMDLEVGKESNRQALERDKIQLQREKMINQQKIEDKKLEIAGENQNYADLKKKQDKKERDQKKKTK